MPSLGNEVLALHERRYQYPDSGVHLGLFSSHQVLGANIYSLHSCRFKLVVLLHSHLAQLQIPMFCQRFRRSKFCI